MISFENRIPSIVTEIEKRRFKYFLSYPSFEDASQMILERAFKKYHLYDEAKGKFEHWINRFISSALKNIWRDHYGKHSRPCICGCRFNLGGETCRFTKSGLQDITCPIYEKWKNKKETQNQVSQTLPIENHIDEVHNISSDFLSIDDSKKVIDEKIKGKLTEQEYKVYVLLFIENKTMEEVGEIMRFPRMKNAAIPGYQIIHKMKKKFVVAAKEIIEEEDLT